MYTPGTLIYFDPFHFENGNESKPKYFLVLKNIDENSILASLPSSKNHLPAGHEMIHGCLEMPESCINCYIFKANKPITKTGWSFAFDTMLYGNWIDDFNIEKLKATYSIKGVDYEIIGELIDAELEKIIHCFANSSTVKRRYKKILGR